MICLFQCSADSVWLNESEIDQHVSTVEPYMLGPEPVKFIQQVRDGGGMLSSTALPHSGNKHVKNDFFYGSRKSWIIFLLMKENRKILEKSGKHQTL